MKTTTLLRNTVRQAFWATALVLVFFKPASAQEGFVGDGFGGRSWYKPANMEAGYRAAGGGAGIIKGQLYIWGGITGTALISPAPGVAGTTPPSIPFLGAVTYNGQLEGDGSTAGYSSNSSIFINPYPVAGFSNVKLISLTSVNGLIKTDGTGWVWGANYRCAFGSTTVFNTPVQVVSNAKHVSASMGHVAFVLNDGTVWSVGDNTYGNYGNGTNTPSYTYGNNPGVAMSTTAVKMNGITNAVRVAAMGQSLAGDAQNGTIVLKSDGTVWVAGGTNSLVSGSASTPVQIAGLSNIVDIKAGSSIGLALTQAGTVYTWGSSAFYEDFGNGIIQTSNYAPVQVLFPPGTPPIVAIESDPAMHTFYALDEDHVLWGWGREQTYLGTYTISYVNEPIIVAKHVLDVNAGTQNVVYVTRTAEYPVDERLWFVIDGSHSSSIMSLNPTYYGIGRAGDTPRNGSNWYTDYRTGGGSTNLFPANPAAFGLNGLGTVGTVTTIAGTVDCGATAIVGSLVAGTPSNVMLKVTATVSTTGTGSFTVTGSGLTPSPSPGTFSTTTTGLQTFYMPMAYDGSALGATTFTFSGLGACTADLSGLTPRPVPTSITPLVNCTPFTSVTISK